MKIVLNGCFGGFHYPEKFCAKFGVEPYAWLDYEAGQEAVRMDIGLIEWVENNPQDAEGLQVVEIPNIVTDWQIHEYDGLESIICVIDGKIVWL